MRHMLSITRVDGIRTQKVTSTSATVRGLRNGQSYILSVTIHNRAEEPSQSSDGAVGTLYGFPGTPSSVAATVIKAGADGQSATVQVLWNRGGPEDFDWGSTAVSIGGTSISVDKNQMSMVISGVVPEISHEVRIQTSNIHGNTSNVGISSVKMSTIPLVSATDNFKLEPTGVEGEPKVRGLSEKGGRGYDLNGLQTHYATVDQACSANSELLDMTRMTINSHSNDPVSYPFCQADIASAGHPSVSEAVMAQAVASESKPETPALTVPLTSASSTAVKWNVETVNPSVTSVVLIVDGSRVPAGYRNGAYTFSELEAGKAHTFALEISSVWSASSSVSLIVTAQRAGG